MRSEEAMRTAVVVVPTGYTNPLPNSMKINRKYYLINRDWIYFPIKVFLIHPWKPWAEPCLIPGL
jgi:hypothetical protein